MLGMSVRINFSRGGKVDILLIFFRLLSMQCKWTYTKNVQCYGNSCIDGFPCKKLAILVSMDVLRLSWQSSEGVTNFVNF